MWLRSALVVFSLLLIWQLIVSLFQLPAYLLPGPWQVALTLYANKLLLWQQAWPTILESLIGLLIASVWAMVMALAMSLWRPVRFWLLPILVLSQAIPTFAVAPFLVVWLGYGMSSKVAVIIFALFFPITIAFYDGLRRTELGWLDMSAVMQASRWRELWYIRMPAAFPALASGLRVAAAWAPMAAVVGEWVGASRGLGFLMLDANARLDIALMFAALMVLIVFSLLLYFVIDHTLRWAMPWQQEN
jgi:putative hydroxymethylpyrimidine transport system permease protein